MRHPPGAAIGFRGNCPSPPRPYGRLESVDSSDSGCRTRADRSVSRDCSGIPRRLSRRGSHPRLRHYSPVAPASQGTNAPRFTTGVERYHDMPCFPRVCTLRQVMISIMVCDVHFSSNFRFNGAYARPWRDLLRHQRRRKSRIPPGRDRQETVRISRVPHDRRRRSRRSGDPVFIDIDDDRYSRLYHHG
jgi:hypothetical protein